MNVLKNGEIRLYGTVGVTPGYEGFTQGDVVDALAALRGRRARVYINSPGGFVDEALGIYNLLARHKGGVSVYVEGVAASGASLIAMAGKEIVMRRGSLMMVHDPSGVTMGNADDHKKSTVELDAMGDAMAEIYAARCARPAGEIRAEMRAETWMNGAQAVEKGYATRTDSKQAIQIAAFDYRLFGHAPEQLVAFSDSLLGRAGGKTGSPSAPVSDEALVDFLRDYVGRGNLTSGQKVALQRYKIDHPKAYQQAQRSRTRNGGRAEPLRAEPKVAPGASSSWDKAIARQNTRNGFERK